MNRLLDLLAACVIWFDEWEYKRVVRDYAIAFTALVLVMTFVIAYESPASYKVHRVGGADPLTRTFSIKFNGELRTVRMVNGALPMESETIYLQCGSWNDEQTCNFNSLRFKPSYPNNVR